MARLDEIQPVDVYVRSLLEDVKNRHHIQIDLDNPTREQRLEAALAMKDEANGHYSMEIMVGRRVGSDEQELTFLLLAQAMFPQDPRRFYDGFAHQYWPKKE
jgi:hypothetical protein